VTQIQKNWQELKKPGQLSFRTETDPARAAPWSRSRSSAASVDARQRACGACDLVDPRCGDTSVQIEGVLHGIILAPWRD